MYSVKKQNTLFNKGHRWRRYETKNCNYCRRMAQTYYICLIRGCRNYIKEHELDIEISVFHSFGNFSRDEKFNAGEYNIIHLPDLSQFDGIILEVTNMLNQKKRQQIIRIIQESGVPAVSLLEKFRDCIMQDWTITQQWNRWWSI